MASPTREGRPQAGSPISQDLATQTPTIAAVSHDQDGQSGRSLNKDVSSGSNCWASRTLLPRSQGVSALTRELKGQTPAPGTCLLTAPCGVSLSKRETAHRTARV